MELVTNESTMSCCGLPSSRCTCLHKRLATNEGFDEGDFLPLPENPFVENVERGLSPDETLPLPVMNFDECNEGCDCSKCSKRNSCDRASTMNEEADDFLPLPSQLY